ncbi:diguanylate cyclase (GGDEF) domain-containing protein [Methylophaga sulfidovorans]|uniref:Diguanylate cyclase (GGDEF) domain-containing protein n=1 Tax=Methylophaga sulfidovorans TaxID=45496 RepID=A0A1I3XEV5_9GAMM|nr:diguanylate cyclase (GGDEF) domain-containing protein [Methylophaga sulfidovorans]
MGALLIILVTVVLFTIAIKRAFSAMEYALDERTRQIEFMALHDDLTQLPNRAMFCKMVQQQIRECKRYQRIFSMLFIDLDGFKAVNDNLGHDAGDELLKQVAKRINTSIRDSDIASRLGGDEFVVLLPEVSGVEEHKHVDVIAGRILNTIAEAFEINGQVIHITASIGISCYPEHGDNEDELTKHADAAMYAAKESGKNSIQRYSAELHRQSFERRVLEADLNNALHNHEFEMFYQAKLDSQSVEVIGMEALIRWHHPNLGLVEPNDFIGIAEDTGLIIPIGKWVMETACRQNMQ